MKKLYTLSLLVASAVAFAQTPVITGIMDGDCTGGNPKVLEIYANGTVNFAEYAVENQTNATTETWGQTMNLSALGTKTDTFVYVVHGDPAVVGPIFTAEFAAVPAANVVYSGVGSGVPQPLNVNGDDRVRLINATSSAVIDQFGTSDVDGTGLAWEYLDSWAKRNNGTGPDAGFVEANWTYGGVAVLDGLGVCQSAAAFSTVVPFGQYSLKTAQNDISGLSIYPNPVTAGTLYINTANNDVKSVQIFDVVGKQVLNATSVENAVNVSALNSGVYVVKITEAGKTATRKLVIR